MHDALLSREEVGELVDLIVRADLCDPQRRPLLLAGIPETVAGNLRIHDRAIDQVEADLLGLSRLRRVDGLDGPPLAVWLDNARRRALCVSDRERIEALRVVLARRAAGQAAPGGGRSKRVSGGLVAAFVVGAVAAGAWGELAGGSKTASAQGMEGGTRSVEPTQEAAGAGERAAGGGDGPSARAPTAGRRPSVEPLRLPARPVPAPSLPARPAATPLGELLDRRASTAIIPPNGLEASGLIHLSAGRAKAHDRK